MPVKYSKTKTTEQYWKDRFNFVESLPDRTEKEMLNHLKGLYQNATLEINKEIEAFYGRYAENNQLTLSEVKKRLNPKELESAKKEIAKYYSEIDRLARTPSGKVSAELLRKYKDELRLQSAKAYMSRLEDLKIRIKNSLVKMGIEEDKQIHDSLIETSENSYTKSAYEISKHKGFANTYSDTQFEKIVNERWLGENYSDRVWKNKQLLEKELEKTFLQGVVRGQSPRKIAGIMHETLEDSINKDFVKSYYACERLARTEMIHTLNESTMESYKDYGIKQYQFVCGLDERTCPECGALDGEVFDIKDKMEGVNYPVIHPNCVLGDSVVLSPDAEKMTRCEYSGNIFKFITSKGRDFSVTPNHIMLTSRGWVRAKNIVKGDKVIYYLGWDKFVKDPANNDVIPTIENLFTSFSKDFSMLASSVKSSSENFKGDVSKDTKIDIIDIDGFLRDKCDVSFKKFISDLPFVFADERFESLLPRQRTLAEFLVCVSLAFDGSMGVDSVLDVFFSSSFTHHQLVGLRSPSDYDARLQKTIINDSSCDIECFRKFIDAFSTVIQFDDIVDIQVSDFSGHIYDISSSSTSYIVNGFVSSNCRCTTIPYFEKDEIDAMFEQSDRIAKDKNGDTISVPDDMTYSEWVEKFKNK